MKKVLSAVLICALAFSLCSCSLFGGSDKKDKSGSKTNSVAETTAPLDKTKAEGYVVTKIEKKLPFSGDFQITGEKGLKNELVPTRMPQLSLSNGETKLDPESDLAQTERNINLEITAKYKALMQTLQKPADNHDMDRIDYICTLNGDILSLIIEKRTVGDNPNSFFDVYNIDLKTGKQLSRSETVALSTTEMKKTQAYVKNAINKIYDEMEKDADSATKAKIKNARIVSTSDENLENTDYYFDKDKHLVLIYHYKGVNGDKGYGVLTVTKAMMKEDKKDGKDSKQASGKNSKQESKQSKTEPATEAENE